LFKGLFQICHTTGTAIAGTDNSAGRSVTPEPGPAHNCS
jgi:hypothetical protein